MKKNEQELRHFHIKLKKILSETMNMGFEITLAVFRRLIRTDYHSITLENIPDLISEDIENELITIRIDTQTPKSVYKNIIDDIYKESALTAQIKDSETISKENKLILIFDIYYYSQYEDMGVSAIGNKLIAKLNHDSNTLHDIEKKEIRRYLKMIDSIQKASLLNKQHK